MTHKIAKLAIKRQVNAYSNIVDSTIEYAIYGGNMNKCGMVNSKPSKKFPERMVIEVSEYKELIDACKIAKETFNRLCMNDEFIISVARPGLEAVNTVFKKHSKRQLYLDLQLPKKLDETNEPA